MRKFLLIVMVIIFWYNVNAQSTNCGNVFNPTDQTDNVFRWYPVDNSYHYIWNGSNIINPFVSNNAPHLDNIVSGQDYLEEDGWVFINSNIHLSEPSNPVVVLYNRFTGIIRAMVYVNEVFSEIGGSISVNLLHSEDSPLSNILTHGSGSRVVALDSIAGRDTLIHLNGKFISENGVWYYGDFQTAYDPCVCKLAQFVGLRTELHVNRFQSITGTLNALPYKGLNNSLTSNSNIFASISKLQSLDKPFKDGFESGQQLAKLIERMKPNYVSPSPTEKKDATQVKLDDKAFRDLSNIQKAQYIASMFPKVGAVVGGGVAIFDFISNFNKPKAVNKPTTMVVLNNFKIDAKITEDITKKSYKFGVPTAAGHLGILYRSQYDNHIGLLNLLNTPKVKISRYIEKFPNQKGVPSGCNCSFANPPEWANEGLSHIQVELSEPLKWVLNQSSGIDLSNSEIKAVIELDSTLDVDMMIKANDDGVDLIKANTNSSAHPQLNNWNMHLNNWYFVKTLPDVYEKVKNNIGRFRNVEPVRYNLFSTNKNFITGRVNTIDPMIHHHNTIKDGMNNGYSFDVMVAQLGITDGSGQIIHGNCSGHQLAIKYDLNYQTYPINIDKLGYIKARYAIPYYELNKVPYGNCTPWDSKRTLTKYDEKHFLPRVYVKIIAKLRTANQSEEEGTTFIVRYRAKISSFEELPYKDNSINIQDFKDSIYVNSSTLFSIIADPSKGPELGLGPIKVLNGVFYIQAMRKIVVENTPGTPSIGYPFPKFVFVAPNCEINPEFLIANETEIISGVPEGYDIYFDSKAPKAPVSQFDLEQFCSSSVYNPELRNNLRINKTVNYSNENDYNVFVYPNPSSGVVTLQGAEEAQISVYTMLGALAYSGKCPDNNTLDLSNLPKGSYIVKIIRKNEVLNSKLVLE